MRPRVCTRPLVGDTMPPMSLSSVLLPEPFGPSRPTVVPAWISSVTSSTAVYSCRCSASSATGVDDSLFERVVLADGELLRDVLDAHDDGTDSR